MVESCRGCEPCAAGLENYCEGPNSFLATYNGPMTPAAKASTGQNMYEQDNTYGGYSNVMVVAEDFVLKIPSALPVEKVAPILCAGVTTFSPMRHWGVKAGDKVGVIGFGGLGDMAVKLARAMGAEVVVFTTTEEKLADAASRGATGVYVKDAASVMQHVRSFDFMISTIPEASDLNTFVPLLKRDASLVVVGALEMLKPFNNMFIAARRNTIGGSLIGSIAETQEVLEFCAQHGVTPDVEVIPIQRINEAYKQIAQGDVRFRYVIDMASLKPIAEATT